MDGGVVEGSKVLPRVSHYRWTHTGWGRAGKTEIADYVLVYKGQKIAVIEAKRVGLSSTEGAAQAKAYAEKLQIEYTYSTNGKEIHEISMKSGKEGLIGSFPTPDELWSRINGEVNEWKEKFLAVPTETVVIQKVPGTIRRMLSIIRLRQLHQKSNVFSLH